MLLAHLIAIVVVIGYHELGHLLIARFFGIGVQEYSIGFGPLLFSKRIGTVRYSVRLIPLGGFVDPVDFNDVANVDNIPDAIERNMIRDTRCWFANQPLIERLLMLAAGPIFNFMLAWMLFLVFGKATLSLSGLEAVFQSLVNDEVKAAFIGIPTSSFAVPHNVFSGVSLSFAAGIAPFCRHLVLLNTAIGLFNLIPVPPLDGGGIIREFVMSAATYKKRGKKLDDTRETVLTIWGILSLVGIAALLYFWR